MVIVRRFSKVLIKLIDLNGLCLKKSSNQSRLKFHGVTMDSSHDTGQKVGIRFAIHLHCIGIIFHSAFSNMSVLVLFCLSLL